MTDPYFLERMIPTPQMLTRRRVVQQGAAAVLTGTVGYRGLHRQRPAGTVPAAVLDAGSRFVDPSLVHTLAMQAIDAAKAAGATYADVRLTRTVDQALSANWNDEKWDGYDDEQLGIGVRALVNGYWGFAATPYWTAAEAVRVAAIAVAYAKVNAQGPARSVAFAPMPAVTGSWHTPITIDPFRISVEEKLDFLRGVQMTARRLLPEQVGTLRIAPGISGGYWSARFIRQEQALATTDGSYLTQTFYRSQGNLPIFGGDENNSLIGGHIWPEGLTERGRGWEMFPDAKILDQLPGMYERLVAQLHVPAKPVEVGRKPLVCDATTMAGLLDATFGRATEVDRALGYEANANGTSYLGPDPLTVLGTQVANSAVTVTANRSLATGLATARWDAEGLPPDDFPLIKNGVLVDYQTTREQAAWLAPWYARAGTAVKSHGCAAAENATFLTMQMTPNLALAPASGNATFEDMVAALADGIVIEGGETTTDFQCKNGVIDSLNIFEVKQGKRVARLKDAVVLFNAIELWKNITVLGGTASVAHVPGAETKGEPNQTTTHTVSVVPGTFKNVALVNNLMKA